MKRCISCGREIPETSARGDSIRKYCPECALQSKRRSKAEWMREFRKTQEAEIAVLKKIVQRQRDELKALKEE